MAHVMALVKDVVPLAKGHVRVVVETHVALLVLAHAQAVAVTPVLMLTVKTIIVGGSPRYVGEPSLTIYTYGRY